MGKMTCPVCGKLYDEQDIEFLDNGNPACPQCVALEAESSQAQLKQTTKK